MAYSHSNDFCKHIPPSLELLAVQLSFLDRGHWRDLLYMLGFYFFVQILFPKMLGVLVILDAYHQYKGENRPHEDEFRSHDINLNGLYKPPDLEWVIAIAKMK
jgi:hypothetical protein